MLVKDRHFEPAESDYLVDERVVRAVDVIYVSQSHNASLSAKTIAISRHDGLGSASSRATGSNPLPYLAVSRSLVGR